MAIWLTHNVLHQIMSVYAFTNKSQYLYAASHCNFNSVYFEVIVQNILDSRPVQYPRAATKATCLHCNWWVGPVRGGVEAGEEATRCCRHARPACRPHRRLWHFHTEKDQVSGYGWGWQVNRNISTNILIKQEGNSFCTLSMLKKKLNVLFSDNGKLLKVWNLLAWDSTEEE